MKLYLILIDISNAEYSNVSIVVPATSLTLQLSLFPLPRFTEKNAVLMNIRGLLSVRNKKDKLKQLAERAAEDNVVIIVITEPEVSKGIVDAEVQIEGLTSIEQIEPVE